MVSIDAELIYGGLDGLELTFQTDGYVPDELYLANPNPLWVHCELFDVLVYERGYYNQTKVFYLFIGYTSTKDLENEC